MPHSLEQPDDPIPNSPTQKQSAFMHRHRIHPDGPVDLYEAHHTIRKYVQTRRQLAPTAKQESFLKDRGKWRKGMSRGEAFDLIKWIHMGSQFG